MQMKATKFILNALKQEGIEHLFMVPGGLIDPFYEDLGTASGVTPIVAAHEGGACYMADGFARTTGGFGVCLCIGGPGLANVVTALTAASTDNSPLLVLSGEVPTNWEGRGGFQDASPTGLNDVELVRPLTAYSFQVENTYLLNHHLRAALQHMSSTRRAPVHLSIPKDIQSGDIKSAYSPFIASVWQPRLIDKAAVAKLWDLLSTPEPAARIAILVGHGVERSMASEAVLAFAERYQIPVATTLKAKGVVPEDHPLSVGIFGYAGTRHATELLLGGECEVLIVLGSGLDQRDTMYWNVNLRPKRGLVQVDIDPVSLGKNYPIDLGVLSDCFEFVQSLEAADHQHADVLASGIESRRQWLAATRAQGSLLYEEENTLSDAVPMHPARVIAEARRAMPRNTVAVVDSGAHRAFAGHYWRSYAPRQYISATNIGPMGWAIPAAIGAKVARPELPTMVITGDGCMLMHGMEIQTAARYKLPVIFLVINNSALGNVYLRASKVSAEGAELTMLPTHDWVMFARSLGANGVTVEDPAKLDAAFSQALAATGPFVIDARCGRDYTTPVTPWKKAAQEWVDEA
jgi:acetolactate synthase-1/2/3 large subunit